MKTIFKKCKHCENECIEDFDMCFACLQSYKVKSKKETDYVEDDTTLTKTILSKCKCGKLMEIGFNLCDECQRKKKPNKNIRKKCSCGKIAETGRDLCYDCRMIKENSMETHIKNVFDGVSKILK